MATFWTPTPLALNAGAPFSYSHTSISNISRTEAFVTGIDFMDKKRCIVCGRKAAVEHCHIVPKVEGDRWEFLKAEGLIPLPSKSVAREARNGVLMCRNHHDDFNKPRFYIRWEPMCQCFVFINHSREPDIEPFHGRAVRLFHGDERTPFYGAFIDQEMRVRGRYPYEPAFSDRAIVFPIQWQGWITDARSSNGEDGGDNGGNNGGDSGVSKDEADDRGGKKEEDEEGGREHTGDMEMDDISATLLPLHTSQSSEQDDYDNTTANSLHSNEQTSVFHTPHPVQYHHVTHPTAKHPKPDSITSAQNLHAKKKPPQSPSGIR